MSKEKYKKKVPEVVEAEKFKMPEGLPSNVKAIVLDDGNTVSEGDYLVEQPDGSRKAVKADTFEAEWEKQ